MKPRSNRRNGGAVRRGRASAGALCDRARSLSFVWMLAVLQPLAGATPDDPDVPADVVELLDGTKIEGRVVFEDKDKIVVLVGTREREIERAKVAGVQSIAGSLKWRAHFLKGDLSPLVHGESEKINGFFFLLPGLFGVVVVSFTRARESRHLVTGLKSVAKVLGKGFW